MQWYGLSMYVKSGHNFLGGGGIGKPPAPLVETTFLKGVTSHARAK